MIISRSLSLKSKFETFLNYYKNPRVIKTLKYIQCDDYWFQIKIKSKNINHTENYCFSFQLDKMISTGGFSFDYDEINCSINSFNLIDKIVCNLINDIKIYENGLWC